MTENYSLHKINNELITPFSEKEYSRFKFGDSLCAKKFAKELFAGFIEKYKDLVLEQTEIILFPSPYYSIPTASNYLCSFFKEELNMFLSNNDKNSCIESKIYRKQTYTQDYGNMSYQQRLNLISNDTYYIDSNFVSNKFCIFLDDIKITGSHEYTINKVLNDYNVNGKFLFLYFAELINKQIDPKIENYYNYFAIKNPIDIVNIINYNYFCFNTRIIKYILLMNQNDFQFVTENISEKIKNQMLNLAISNNYHKIEEYKLNINNLKYNLKWQSTYKKDKDKTLTLQNLLSD